MDQSEVTYEVVGPVARVGMNRPRYKNAQSLQLLEGLDAAFTRAVDDPEVRVIVLHGEGDGFSAGHDLGTPEYVADRESRPYGKREMGLHGRMRTSWHEHEMFARWRDLPKPTIAMVHGYAIFNGWIVAAAMDLIFAAEDALFLPPSGAAIWDLGARKAKELRFRNRFLTAKELYEIGLVNRVVPADRLEAEVMEYANEVAEQDPHTLWMAKMAINQMENERGFANFVRGEFGFYWVNASQGAGGARERVAGRIRSKHVQRAFERAGRPEAQAKGKE